MKCQKNVDLGMGFNVTVSEMTVGEVRQLLKDFTNGDLGDINIMEAIGEKFELITNRLNKFIELPEGKKFDDLTASELKAIWEEFIKLNPFFQPIQKLIETAATMSPAQLAELIKPASS
jgi:septation ring formation regulator EzrA